MISLPSKSYLQRIARTLAVFLFASTLTLDPLVTAPANANGLGPSTYLDGACNIGDSDPANHLTPETAFVIDTVDKLWEVTDCSSTSATVYFRIDRDLDASDANFASTSSPIGYSISGISSFSGVLNGGGFQISVSMATNHGVGLFALLEDAEINNLILQGSYSTSTTDNNSSSYAGALAVRGDGHLTISSVANQAGLSGFHEVGGLIGRASGSVSLLDVENSGVIQGGSFRVGGLIGYAIGDVSINSSRNAATVSALGSYVGGFVGQSSGAAEISESENLSQVLGKINNGGGFVGGASELLVLSSTNSGKVTGNGTGGDNNNFGGFVGIVTAGAALNNSQNLGAILSTKPHVGGVIGKADGPITLSFAVNSGAVTGTDYVGGLVGRSTVRASFTQPENRGPVSGTGQYAGGLVGYNHGSSELSRAINSGAIFGADRVGGFMGFAQSIEIFDSLNSGAVTAGNIVGGLIGTSDFVEVSSSSNQASISASGFHVGGLVGEASTLLVSDSRNEGRVSALYAAGGLAGVAFSGAEIVGSTNLAVVTGSGDYSGGLLGYSNGTVTVSGSSNLRAVSGTSNVGGLLGYVGGDATITSSFNTGSVSGSNIVGGLIAYVGGDASLNASYAIGVISGAPDSDGLLGSTAGTVTANALYASFVSSYAETSTVAAMKLAATYVGFDFNTIWGFGSCGDNEGFPMLRASAMVTTYFQFSCGLNAALVSEPTPSPAPVYSGPLLDSGQSVVAGQEVSFPGRRLGSVDSAFAGNTNLTIVSAADELLVLDVPANLTAGVYDLVIHSGQGTLTFQNGLTVEASTTDLIEPEAATRLTVGYFNGVVAIYTKGYEGAKLSAKIAGKWLVVDALDESFKGKNYSRTVRFTGAGYSILVHLYINGELIKTEELITQ